MNNIEDYQNMFILLKQTLAFYADELNYKSVLGSPIAVDLDKHGSQARFALSKIKELEEINQKILDDYSKMSDKMVDSIEDSFENNDLGVEDIIDTFKKIKNGNQDIQ
jgi:hypothetical protein